jgi:O-methyltransferase
VPDRGGSQRLRSAAELLRRGLRGSDAGARDDLGYAALRRIGRWVLPDYVLTDHSKAWFADRAFFADFHRLVPDGNARSADRKYFLRSLLSLTDSLPGDTAECGVWNGSSSWFICDHFRDSAKVHHGFDSFEGLSHPTKEDGGYWQAGDLRSVEQEARATLAGYEVVLHKGWIPERFAEVAQDTFCFVHIDVDLFQPTLDSLEFFYPRMVAGGVMLFDDYGFLTCPGATEAVDGFMAQRPEPVIDVPTGQAFLIKA